MELADVLLRAARELLDAGGPGALSVRDIAARAGVAPMGVYKRFGSKSGILDVLLTAGFDELAAAVAPPADHISSDGSPFEPGHELARLAEGMERYRTFALENPSIYTLMFDRSESDEAPSEVALAAARRAFDELVTAVRLGIASREIEPGDPVEIAQRIWAGCHGAVSLELRGISFVTDTRTHYTALVATLLRGLAAPPCPR